MLYYAYVLIIAANKNLAQASIVLKWNKTKTESTNMESDIIKKSLNIIYSGFYSFH